MVNMNDGFLQQHEEYYAGRRETDHRGRITAPGMQYLVHLLKGGYLGDDWRQGEGRRALDVGCGSGYNSVTLAMMGWQVYGCEISQEIVRRAKANITSYGYDIPIEVGENEQLPYPNDSFHLLVSINVIHYVQSDEAAVKTVSEYARVLKNGGRLILSTNHSENWLLKGCDRLGDNIVRVNCPGDYRDGQKLFLFSTDQELRYYFSPHFEDILTGENKFDFFTRTIRNTVLTGLKQNG